MITAEQLASMRKEYSGKALDLKNSSADPLNLFTGWFHEALESRLSEPNAMMLATVNSNGVPSVRTVLLKIFDSRGFVFFTNYNSHKGTDIKENPRGEILLIWLELERQVRINGLIEKTTSEESDQYFSSRPFLACLSAIASPQSQLIKSESVIRNSIKELQEKYPEEGNVPRPEYWGGYRLIPESYEFWQGRPDRLHSRLFYRKEDCGWTKHLLAP